MKIVPQLSKVVIALMLLPCLSLKAKEVVYEQVLEPLPFPIIVPAHLGENVVQLMFDTGANIHAFDLTLKDALTEEVGESNLRTMDAEAVTKMFKAPPLSLGKFELPEWFVLTRDYTSMRQALGINVSGTMTLASLKEFAVEFNFDDERLRIYKDYEMPNTATLYAPGEEAKGVKYTPFAKSKKKGQIAINYFLDGQLIYALVDTGSNGAVGLEHSIFVSLVESGMIKLQTELPAGTRATPGNSTTVKGVGHFTRGNLLGLPLAGMPVQDSGAISNIGMAYLLNYNFTVDLKRDLLLFSIRQNEPAVRAHYMLGVLLKYEDGQGHVLEVLPDGAADKAGIKKGDLISKLGPLNKGELNAISVYKLCRDHAGKEVEVKFSRGGKDEITSARLVLPEKQFMSPPRKDAIPDSQQTKP